MSINKFSINALAIGLFLIIVIPTIYKVVQRHQQAIYEVNEKLIIEKAKDCYYKKDCPENKVTLKELYEKKYLKDTIIDPKSKEELNEMSYVLIEKEKSTFYLK